MLKPKTHIFPGLLLIIVLLVVFPILFQTRCLAGTTDSGLVRDHLKKRIASSLSQNHFTCRGELVCGASQIPVFYEQRGFSPAWCTDDGVLPQTRSLIEEITGAYDEGLRPDGYHLAGIITLLREVEKRQAMEEAIDPGTLVDLDLLLTDAFMLYSSHLLAGRVNPETMHTDWIVEVPANDLIGTLQSALASNQVTETLRALRPHHPGYIDLKKYLTQYRRLAKRPSRSSPLSKNLLQKGDRTASVQPLRERLTALGDLESSDQEKEHFFDEQLEQAVFRFQKRHGLKQDGIVGPQTLERLNTPIEMWVRQIELNMERWRWIPRYLGNRYILVNIADFTLRINEDRHSKLRMRVVVGKPYRRTPVFSAKMNYMVINPYWNIPRSLTVEDLLPKIKKNEHYLAQQGIRVFEDWSRGSPEMDPVWINWEALGPDHFPYRLRQDPGPQNALGRIKFMFPNRFAVYLHDTPKHSLFQETTRDFSSGCIRTEKPIDLALYLLQDNPQWTRDILLETIESGKRKVVNLRESIPVHLQYWTAWVDENGRLNFRDDIYGRDRPLDRALRERLPKV
jgi:murein L,D-transpeptidase YcbB/YkuD